MLVNSNVVHINGKNMIKYFVKITPANQFCYRIFSVAVVIRIRSTAAISRSQPKYSATLRFPQSECT